MNEHPIEGLMVTAMNSIRDMIDVNTIIGDPIQGPGNIMIIPISKVGFGFASGGSEFNGETIDAYKKKEKEEEVQYRLPFGGGSGAGVSINPVAFIVVQGENVKILPVSHTSSIDRLLDYVPDLIDKVNSMLNKQMDNKQEMKDLASNKEKIAKNEQENNEREIRIQKLEENEKENKKEIQEIKNEGKKTQEEVSKIKESNSLEEKQEIKEYMEKLKEEIGAELRNKSKENIKDEGKSKEKQKKRTKTTPKIKKNIEIEFANEDFLFDEDE